MKSIGILSGAGPQAGALLLERVIHLCQTLHNCKEDADFPRIHLLSYPFSPMLDAAKLTRTRPQIIAELTSCFDTFRALQVDLVAIACNTLHTFLTPPMLHSFTFISIGTALQKHIHSLPLVLCSQTSATNRFHAQYFPCLYLEPPAQQQVDALIDDILTGHLSPSQSRTLQQLLPPLPSTTQIVLGCTELSLLHNRFPLPTPHPIVDSLETLAQELVSCLKPK